MRANGELWDFFEPSPRAPISPAVLEFSRSLALDPASDPLRSFRRIGTAVQQTLAYAPHSTAVDTPIEDALEARRGVCQDFAHIALAVARVRGIPCRYVSGYLAPPTMHPDPHELATHAWIEGWFPGPGWIAIDPTHNQAAGEQHIAVAVGRDYQDAAPTRGVFRGEQAGTLAVSVRIQQGDGAASASEMVFPLPSPAPVPARTFARSDQ
jgi:transglutaminase-like putative cysteine protease